MAGRCPRTCRAISARLSPTGGAARGLWPTSAWPSREFPGWMTAPDAYRLFLAEELLDAGMSPAALMKGLGFDAPARGLAKYDPNQPRVPAGSGRNSGRWGSGGGNSSTNNVQTALNVDPHVANDVGPDDNSCARRGIIRSISSSKSKRRPYDRKACSEIRGLLDKTFRSESRKISVGVIDGRRSAPLRRFSPPASSSTRRSRIIRRLSIKSPPLKIKAGWTRLKSRRLLFSRRATSPMPQAAGRNFKSGRPIP